MALLMNLEKGVKVAIITDTFVGCFIYANYITLLAPSREALNNMLDVCMEYAEAHDILFNARRTKCMFFSNIKPIVFCLIKMFN